MLPAGLNSYGAADVADWAIVCCGYAGNEEAVQFAHRATPHFLDWFDENAHRIESLPPHRAQRQAERYVCGCLGIGLFAFILSAAAKGIIGGLAWHFFQKLFLNKEAAVALQACRGVKSAHQSE